MEKYTHSISESRLSEALDTIHNINEFSTGGSHVGPIYIHLASTNTGILHLQPRLSFHTQMPDICSSYPNTSMHSCSFTVITECSMKVTIHSIYKHIIHNKRVLYNSD